MYARYVYTVDLVLFYLRVLELYYVNRRLGPKVVVIGRMVRLQCVSYFFIGLLRGLFTFLEYFLSSVLSSSLSQQHKIS